ncbi:hypothetical protein [Endozoicomonas sp. 4G]|uniref:hypothetical protein n=1 Tax=Endozoicomonas sp. 4G TaxID=2872754 RepID=UPI00207857F7|nr:hypothetical protein [Endozoicomonas sp. 4G]
MNIQGCSAATYINRLDDMMHDRTLIDGIGGFKGSEEKATFYSLQAKRNYHVSVRPSSDQYRFVEIDVTAETGRKNIFSRIIGAVFDAFKRSDEIGMNVFGTRAHQMKSKLENDILNKAMDAAIDRAKNPSNRSDADKKIIEDGFKAATQFNRKFHIREVDNETRFTLAKSLFKKYHDKSLLLQLAVEIKCNIYRLEENLMLTLGNEGRAYFYSLESKFYRIMKLSRASNKTD